MIVIMTVIRSFGNAEDATMIVVIRVIILIIFMMIVIIVITFIIVIMIVITSSLSIHFKCGFRHPWYYDDRYHPSHHLHHDQHEGHYGFVLLLTSCIHFRRDVR